MLRAGMNLAVLMKILGHRSVGMTLRYLQVTLGDTRQAYLESMEWVKTRYCFPDPPAHFPLRQGMLTNPAEIQPELKTMATEIEGLRRDYTSGPQRRKLQRLVERLRKLASDLEKSGFDD